MNKNVIPNEATEGSAFGMRNLSMQQILLIIPIFVLLRFLVTSLLEMTQLSNS